jgi:hypothetical protein
MKLTVKPGAVPPGSYRAHLAAVESTQHDQYGPGLRFVFVVADGLFAGLEAGRTTGCVPTPRNALGRLLAGLLGRNLTIDEDVELEELIGRDYLIVVAETETGGSRVEAVSVPSVS